MGCWSRCFGRRNCPGGRSIYKHGYVARSYLFIKYKPSELLVSGFDLLIGILGSDPRDSEAIGSICDYIGTRIMH